MDTTKNTTTDLSAEAFAYLVDIVGEARMMESEYAPMDPATPQQKGYLADLKAKGYVGDSWTDNINGDPKHAVLEIEVLPKGFEAAGVTPF